MSLTPEMDISKTYFEAFTGITSKPVYVMAPADIQLIVNYAQETKTDWSI